MRLLLFAAGLLFTSGLLYVGFRSRQRKQIAENTMLPDVWRAIVGADDHQFV